MGVLIEGTTTRAMALSHPSGTAVTTLNSRPSGPRTATFRNIDAALGNSVLTRGVLGFDSGSALEPELRFQYTMNPHFPRLIHSNTKKGDDVRTQNRFIDRAFGLAT